MSSIVSSANATGLPDAMVITDRALANGEHLQAVSLDLAVDGGASTPVSAANPLPVTNASLPLPNGASTGAKQDTGNNSVASIDTKTPALGQALAAASTPVVLTAIQQAALTPPAAIAGFALEAGHLAAIDTSVAKIPSQGQALAAASIPVVLTAIQQAALTPPAAITGFALDASVLTLDADLKAEIGVVSDSPGAYTVLDRLNQISRRLDNNGKTQATQLATLQSMLAVLSKPVAPASSTLLHRFFSGK